MNNLDHPKGFYQDNYKMDLSEAMKAALSKGASTSQGGSSSQMMASDMKQGKGLQGMGYVTEKLYMLLQVYLQNKNWNPSTELLQCFSELKDNTILPNAAYLQVLANRLTLDAQGRLILRENGKIVLPFEHFANAVMLKHMSGPHGLHLNIEATIRAVVDSYTIGRENFGMEKEFVVEVVQSCPNPACRYYKNQMNLTPMSFIEQTYQGVSPEFLHLLPPSSSMSNEIDLNKASHVNSQKSSQLHMLQKQQQQMPQGISQSMSSIQQQQHLQPHTSHHQQQQQQQQQQQITAVIIQQQNRAMSQQNLEKFGSLNSAEKQRMLQKMDKHYENPSPLGSNMGKSVSANLMQSNMQGNVLQHQICNNQQAHLSSPKPSNHHAPPLQSDLSKSENVKRTLESLESNKDLLTLHNDSWVSQESRDNSVIGQDKIVRAFTELMKNMARMKTFIRPSMCKPYGKQSESLQKTLLDTIQLVQSLRNCLPAPHVPVTSWKSEDRYRKDPETTRVEN